MLWRGARILASRAHNHPSYRLQVTADDGGRWQPPTEDAGSLQSALPSAGCTVHAPLVRR